MQQIQLFYNDISVLSKLNNSVVTIWWAANIKYTSTGSLELFIGQLGTLIYKKDNYVTVLSRSKIAIQEY